MRKSVSITYEQGRVNVLLIHSRYNQQGSNIAYRLMWEPRGHADMYGALLVSTTELTRSGEADIGVLFMHNGTSCDLFAHSMG